MTKQIIFQDSFLVSGIMCHQGCGATIETILSDLDDFKKQRCLPEDAKLVIDAEPQALGVHRIDLIITSDQPDFNPDIKKISTEFKDQFESVGFNVINESSKNQAHQSRWTNWINISINILSASFIILLSVLFPPSILLTIGLTCLSFATTAFTSRHYLINFYNNLRKKDWTNMSSAVALGWLLALAHTVYHAISMPLMSHFSMLFMSFLMPILLITIINGMDEVKRLLMNKSQKMHLQGIKTLFPQMAEVYQTYSLTNEQQNELTQIITEESDKDNPVSTFLDRPHNKISNILKRKNTIMEGDLIQIKSGECFPVDCILLHGSTLVDAALLTGEPQLEKHAKDSIPAGAINLGQSVYVLASANSYNSTINKLLFRSNRAREQSSVQTSRKFTYFYAALIALGLAAAIAIPAGLGLLTIPLLLQNITGILFAVCPCTISIAHQLPDLLSIYSRGKSGIKLSHDQLIKKDEAIHTVVFDKTGTLTTGNSTVDSSEGISPGLWQRIYLLEKKHGAEHPLAKAIIQYFEKSRPGHSLIRDIQQLARDKKNRGLSAVVQGKEIHIGSFDFLRDNGVKKLPEVLSATTTHKLSQGYSAVYIAEEQNYCGVIFVKHEARPTVLTALKQLKQQGVKLIMLTGDNKLSAHGFNQQNGSIFKHEDIHAEQTPQNKEEFLKKLTTNSEIDPKGIWFIGDGLNDAPCARVVSEKGGVSCSMTAEDKSSFFVDLSLNGSLDYLFHHQKLNQFLQKNITQNQWLLGYGSLTFLAFILSFSLMGLALPPLIPTVIMVTTTFFTLFNSYRVKYSAEHHLGHDGSWFKQFLSSELSLGLPVSASILLVIGVLVATIATGGLAFPVLSFSAGILSALASTSVIAACSACAAFVLAGVTCWLRDRLFNQESPTTKDEVPGTPFTKDQQTEYVDHGDENTQGYHFGFAKPGTGTNVLSLNEAMSSVPS